MGFRLRWHLICCRFFINLLFIDEKAALQGRQRYYKLHQTVCMCYLSRLFKIIVNILMIRSWVKGKSAFSSIFSTIGTLAPLSSSLLFSTWRSTEAQLTFTNLMVMWILFHLVTCVVFMCVFLCVCLSRLVDCLRDFEAADWQLAGQACQAMWNLTGGGSEELLDTEDRQTLLKILTEFLGLCSHLSWLNKGGTQAVPEGRKTHLILIFKNVTVA